MKSAAGAETKRVLNFNRVFSIFPPGHSDITLMPDFMAWYEKDNPGNLEQVGKNYAQWISPQIAALPPGRRVIQLRLLMKNESYAEPPMDADPLPVLENNGFFIGRALRMIRPFARGLKQRGLFLDGIYSNCEGGFSFWMLNHDQFKRIYKSSKARANLPPALRNLRPEQLTWGNPEFDREKGIIWNRWNQLMLTRAMRRVLVDSGLFALPRKPGGPLVQPPIMNFNWWYASWPIYDPNGWPLHGTPALDYKTSCPGCYFSMGARYGHVRTHHPYWNTLIDQINWIRSAMFRPDGRVWPVILQPKTSNFWQPYGISLHPWLVEQMVAHFARAGANWKNRCGYIYFNHQDWLRPESDPILVDIMKRHDYGFDRQRLREIPMDCDEFETAGFVTKYEDFVNEVFDGQLPDQHGAAPMRIMPTMMAA